MPGSRVRVPPLLFFRCGTIRLQANLIKTAGATNGVVSSAKRVLRELDPTLPVFDVQSMSFGLTCPGERVYIMPLFYTRYARNVKE